MGGIQCLARICRRLAQHTREYVMHRVISIGAQYFRSGAVLMMPEEGTTWIPSDLDIYLPQQTLNMMLRCTSLGCRWSVMA